MSVCQIGQTLWLELYLAIPSSHDRRQSAASMVFQICKCGTGSATRYLGEITNEGVAEPGAEEEARHDDSQKVTDFQECGELSCRNFLLSGGVERLCAVVVAEGPMDLIRYAAAAVMHLCGFPGTRPEPLIKAVVKVLASPDKHCVHAIQTAIWFLAHDHRNSQLLGKAGAVDGLVSVLKANSDIPVKQSCMAALWLLACEEQNAVRIAVKGGMQVVVGLCHFPFEALYINLHTLSIGILFQLIQIPDIRNLLNSMSLARPLITALHSPLSTTYLKVLAGGLMFELGKSPVQRSRLTAEYGQHALEDAYVTFICAEELELHAVGVFCITSLGMNQTSKRVFGKNGAIHGLVRLLRSSKMPSKIFLKSLHALLNLSTVKENQMEICRRSLHLLLSVTAAVGTQESEFATSILCNLSNNTECRSFMYRAQLDYSSNAMTQSQMLDNELLMGLDVLQNPENDTNANGPTSDLRQRITEWLDNLQGAYARKLSFGRHVQIHTHTHMSTPAWLAQKSHYGRG